MMIVAHGIPVYETLQYDAACGMLDLHRLWRNMAPADWGLANLMCRAQPVQIARNTICKAAIENIKADVILWQDSDIVVEPPDAVALIQSLLTHPNAALMAAPCVLQYGSGEFKPNVWQDEGDRSSNTQHFQAKAVGFGLVAMRVSALAAIGYPWFQFVMDAEKLVGEDIDICRRFREKGLEVWVNPLVRPRHVFRRSFAYGDGNLPFLQSMSTKGP